MRQDKIYKYICDEANKIDKEVVKGLKSMGDHVIINLQLTEEELKGVDDDIIELISNKLLEKGVQMEVK